MDPTSRNNPLPQSFPSHTAPEEKKSSEKPQKVGLIEAARAQKEMKKAVDQLQIEMSKVTPDKRTPEQQKLIDKLRLKVIHLESKVQQLVDRGKFPGSFLAGALNVIPEAALDNMEPYVQEAKKLLNQLADEYKLPEEARLVTPELHREVEGGICTGAGIEVSGKVLTLMASNPSPEDFKEGLVNIVHDLKDGLGPTIVANQKAYKELRKHQPSIIINEVIERNLQGSSHVKDKEFEKETAKLLTPRFLLNKSLINESQIDKKIADFGGDKSRSLSEIMTLQILTESFTEDPNLSHEDRTADVYERLDSKAKKSETNPKGIPENGVINVKTKLLNVLFVMDEIKQDYQKNAPFALEENKVSHEFHQHVGTLVTPQDKSIRGAVKERFSRLKAKVTGAQVETPKLDTKTFIDFRALNMENDRAVKQLAKARGMEASSCEDRLGLRGTFSDKECIGKMRSFPDGVYGMSLVTGESSHFTLYVVKGNDRYLYDPNYGLFKCVFEVGVMQNILMQRVLSKYAPSGWQFFSDTATKDHQLHVHEFRKAA